MGNGFQITDQIFEQISNLVYKEIGVHLPDKKKAMVNSRLSKRIRRLGLASFEEYCQYLKNNKAELKSLYNTLTTNVTRFYREDYHFDFLRNTAFPEFKRGKEKKQIRVWSAGCSTGEEPYTLALELHEFFDITKWDIKILASDINTDVLDKARKGIYTYQQVREVPYDLLTKCFRLRVDENRKLFKVKEKLKKDVVFRRINLNPRREYPIKSELDFIFCRNVFIYFTQEMREEILTRFYKHLKPGGYLFLGHSESIKNKNNRRWKPVEKTTYQKV